MRKAFLMAVVDTILPGETNSFVSGTALPTGSKAGVALDTDNQRHAAVLRVIAENGGGEEAFVAAGATQRAAILSDVEKRNFDTFRALVTALLQDYYETPSVLAAMGWRTGGAQPLGHNVLEADEATLALLDRVRARGPIWRKVS